MGRGAPSFPPEHPPGGQVAQRPGEEAGGYVKFKNKIKFKKKKKKKEIFFKSVHVYTPSQRFQ